MKNPCGWIALAAAGLLWMGTSMRAEEAKAAPEEKKAVPAAATQAPVLLYPVLKDGKWGYIDQAGKLVINPQYDCAWDFHEGLACVQVGLYRGYIDAKGTVVIKPQFAWSGRFSHGLAPAFTKGVPWGDFIMCFQQHGGWKYINREGKPVFGGWYTRPPDYREGVSSYGSTFLDEKGKQVPCEWKPEAVGTFSDGLAGIKKGGLWGYVDHEMKKVIEPQFEEAGLFVDGLAPVAILAEGEKAPEKRDWQWMQRRKLRWQFIDKTGKVVIEPKFEDAWPFSEGLASVKVGGKWGYVDKTGTEAIQPQFAYAWPFSEGRGRILKEGKQGFVDPKGDLLIAPKFDVAWEFSKGLARVEIEGKEGYLNEKGAFVWEPSQ